MRCLACNKRLNGKESTRKYSSNGNFVDLCDRCYSYVADDVCAVDGEGYVEDYEEASEENFEASGYGFSGWEETGIEEGTGIDDSESR